ncbi:putative 2,4-dienoyl-CoA reductase [Marinovum algicola]|uniref:Peroxisomal trans-2-enoyl-CoA reductase n=1 Tax=Marinovum algicola TaxID=42444 RepID=A0A975WBX0_9RHOB|nr:SDR family oxidoreductase [Marinovum algicola]SEJ83469.1 citronellol/citronellal dehydrogenase [Marinovum algicola]SLN62275.1 putative 2,4-dienoyl-CoA reductase [Marinovum algicola]
MGYESVFRTDLFSDRTIIVTGGGSGLGRCTAHELAHLGAHVVIVGRNPDKLETVSQEIRTDGGTVTPMTCDIREEEQVIEVIDRTIETCGRLDGLVNNAGGQYRAELKDITTKGFQAVVRNNLTGGFIFMREAYNRWMEQHGGAIVNITADMWHGWPEMGHSGAARGGMHTLTETAACEWAHAGVRVNSVAPGGIASSGFDQYEPHIAQRLLEYADKVPLPRYGTEAEISAAIVYLLSPAAAYITGSCLRVDGGAPNSRQTWTQDYAPKNIPEFNGFHRAVMPEVLKPKASD